MNIYVESNFILEIALEQEQHLSCEELISLCEQGLSRLILPAFAIAEPYETLIRRAKNRELLTRQIAHEIQHLSRSKPYKERADALQNITSLFVQSIEEEKERFNLTFERIARIAEIIPLTQNVFSSAAHFQKALDLPPQDAIIYASVIEHLQNSKQQNACFLNKNSRDFDDADIVNALYQFNCKMLFNFEHGYNYIKNHNERTSASAKNGSSDKTA